MALFSMRERRIAEAIAGIAFGNPFLPERITLERRALGGDFLESGPVLRVQSDASYDTMFPNVRSCIVSRRRWPAPPGAALALVMTRPRSTLPSTEDLVCYVLYNRHLSLIHQPIRKSLGLTTGAARSSNGPRFSPTSGVSRASGSHFPIRSRPDHLFAVFFQIARAFRSIFENIVGASSPTAQLRAEVWQSIFTYNMRLYIGTFYRHMMGITTLITGPSGSGKELVARAVGQIPLHRIRSEGTAVR